MEEFSSTGEYITKVGTSGSGNGQFYHPTGIAADSNGDIWVADTRNNRVQELSSTGEYIRQFGSEGTGNGQFIEPLVSPSIPQAMCGSPIPGITAYRGSPPQVNTSGSLAPTARAMDSS